MARKIQVLIELDANTKQVTTTGPMSHPEVVVKMLGVALTQVADAMAEQRAEKEKPDIVIAQPDLRIGRA